ATQRAAGARALGHDSRWKRDLSRPAYATRGSDDLSCRARTLPDQGRGRARRPRLQAEVLRVRGHAVTEARDAGQPNDHGATEDAWVVDGLRVGASLDAAHVVLVLGDDPRRTALAALGVARAQSSHRRVAAPAHAAHVADVVGLADGAILVGEAQLADVNVDKLLGRVRAPEPNEDATPASDDVAIAAGSPAPPWWRRLPVPPAAAGIGLALAIALGGIGVWLAARPLASGHEPSTVVRRRNTGAAAGAVPSTLDSLHADSAGARATLVPANPGDSAAAAGYVVLLARFNTLGG